MSKKIVVESCLDCPYERDGQIANDFGDLMVCEATKPRNINETHNWAWIAPYPDWCPLEDN